MSELICLTNQSVERAEYYADKFGFTLLQPDAAPLKLADSGFHLCINDHALFLRQITKTETDVKVDFVEGSSAHRRRFGGGMGQSIAKAIGVTSQYKPTVLDATAGLGRDSFVLASLGCKVQAFERNPVVAALLEDGLNRAKLDDEVGPIVELITLNYGISYQNDALQLTGKQPDIVYLDPMFEHDPKQTAAVKKDMQAFRNIVGLDEDTSSLIDWALQTARCRVAVKRAKKAPFLGDKAPSYSLKGKSNRFDIYALAKVAPEASK